MWRDCARRAPRLGPSRCGHLAPWAVLAAVAAALASACGGDGPTRGQGVGRRSELVIATAPAGLESAVTADTLGWAPGVFRLVGEELEIDGTYLAVFRNASNQSLDLRFDLRFFDADGLFVDHFIPFGLPLRLGPQAAAQKGGTFTIRASHLEHPELLATMQAVVNVALAGD